LRHTSANALVFIFMLGAQRFATLLGLVACGAFIRRGRADRYPGDSVMVLIRDALAAGPLRRFLSGDCRGMFPIGWILIWA
jgi:hypothetical protein